MGLTNYLVLINEIPWGGGYNLWTLVDGVDLVDLVEVIVFVHIGHSVHFCPPTSTLYAKNYPL